jgi:site-specific recombinase XerD
MNKFKEYLQAKGLATKTSKEYIRETALFKRWYTTEIGSCTKKEIISYLFYLKNQGQKVNTRNKNLLILKHYFSFLIEQKQIEHNPAIGIKLQGLTKQKLHNIYTVEELTELLDTYYLLVVTPTIEKQQEKHSKYYEILRRNTLVQQRNYIILQLLVHQGLLAGELLRITTNDINIQQATLFVVASAKGNTRTLPLHATQIGSLMHYIEQVRPELLEYSTNHSDYLFLPSPKGTAKTTRKQKLNSLKHFTQILKKTDKKFTSLTQLRISRISYWITTYGLRKAQYLAGHRNINTTEQYVREQVQDLADNLKNYHPL